MGRIAPLQAALLLACASVIAGRQLHSAPLTPLQKVQSRFFNNTELAAHMREFEKRCRSIALLHLPIGHSVLGEPLLVLELSNQAGKEEAKPSILYIANMHGTETGGRQLLLTLAEWLCANYPRDPLAKRIIEEMHLFIMPTMNPDGYAANTYENANGVNLNRDFPDVVFRKSSTLGLAGTEQPETAAVMKLFMSRQFTAAANMHEGDFVVNYPFDGTASGLFDYNATPDDATFRFLARVYASRNPRIAASTSFPGGITNGADWYAIYGGMQDWTYVKAGVFHVTLELWDPKGLAPLQILWQQNKDSLLQYALWSTLGGLRGAVKRRSTATNSTGLEAFITVNGSSTVTRSAKAGDFYRPLAPSRWPYVVRVTVPSRNSTQVFSVIVPFSGQGVQLNVTA